MHRKTAPHLTLDLAVSITDRWALLRFGQRSQICRQHGERRRDDKIVMVASRLQSEPASRAGLEDELS